jgi:hypothetical protein
MDDVLIYSSTATPDRGEEWKVPCGSEVFQKAELQLPWDRRLAEDESFQKLYNTIGKGERSFPPDCAAWKIQAGECDFDQRGVLCFRERVLIPDWEPLRIALIQKTHDSHITGHPGRDSTSPFEEKLSLARNVADGTSVLSKLRRLREIPPLEGAAQGPASPTTYPVPRLPELYHIR